MGEAPRLSALRFERFPAFQRDEQLLFDGRVPLGQTRAFFGVRGENGAVFEQRADALLLLFQLRDARRQRLQFALFLERELDRALRVAARRTFLRRVVLGRFLRALPRRFLGDAV